MKRVIDEELENNLRNEFWNYFRMIETSGIFGYIEDGN